MPCPGEHADRRALQRPIHADGVYGFSIIYLVPYDYGSKSRNKAQNLVLETAGVVRGSRPLRAPHDEQQR